MLDLIIKSEGSRRLAPATATTTGFSDHSLLTTRLPCTNPPAPKITYTYRNFRHMDATAFRMSLRQTASFTTLSSDPDIAAEQLTQDLKVVLERHAPLKSRTRRVGSSDMRWMTPEANSARKERRRIERRYARTKSDEDRKNFRVACRKTDRLVREARSAHVRSEITGVRQNPRLLWRSIRNLLHPGSSTDVWYQGLNTDNLVIDLSLYFVNKLTKISETIADGLRYLLCVYLLLVRRPTYQHRSAVHLTHFQLSPLLK